MLNRNEWLALQRWLHAALATGYAVAFLAGAVAGFQAHRTGSSAPHPAAAAQAGSLAAGPHATEEPRMASLR